MNSLFRVNMLKDGRWQTWTNYATYEDAEEDACGLITSGHATQVHIPEIGNNGGRIVALISSTPTPFCRRDASIASSNQAMKYFSDFTISY